MGQEGTMWPWGQIQIPTLDTNHLQASPKPLKAPEEKDLELHTEQDLMSS